MWFLFDFFLISSCSKLRVDMKKNHQVDDVIEFCLAYFLMNTPLFPFILTTNVDKNFMKSNINKKNSL